MEKIKGKEQRKQNTRGTRVTTPRAPRPRPSLPPPPPPAALPLHRCPSFPPQAAPLSRRRWAAKSQALLVRHRDVVQRRPVFWFFRAQAVRPERSSFSIISFLLPTKRRSRVWLGTAEGDVVGNLPKIRINYKKGN